MMTPSLGFFLRFTLISYAAVCFFTIGTSLALSSQSNLKILKLVLIFGLITAGLTLSFKNEPSQGRLMIAAIWTSVLWYGFRFGRRLRKNSAKE